MIQKDSILYIHAGLHKTGTTALQLFFHNNREMLLNSGILYPLVDTNALVPYQHRHLTTLIRKQNHEQFYNYFYKLSNISKNILLSSECFLEEEYFIDWFAKLKNMFSSIKIIFYIRRQDDWVESMYKQFITFEWNKQNPNFSEWIASFFDKNQYWKIYNLNWYEIIQNWQSAFGKENIIVKIYYKELFYKNNLYHDFMKILDIEDLTDYSGTNKINSNTITTNRNIIELRRVLRASFSIDKAKEIEQILKSKIPIDNHCFISLNDRKRIMSETYTGNIKLFKEYFNSEEILFMKITDSDYNNWKEYPGMPDAVKTEINKLINNKNHENHEKQ